jgi:hypothetical protein
MSMTLSQPPTQPHPPTKHAARHRLRRWRISVVLAVTFFALFAASVAIGQVSQSYDLACRGMLTAGGRVSATNDFAIIGALGVPVVPPKDSNTSPTYAVRSTDYAVRGGFLPAYPNGQAAEVAADAAQSAPAISEQATVQRLPIVRKAMRIIRGGC